MTDEMLTEAQIKLNFTSNVSAAIDALIQWEELTGESSDKIVKKLLDVDDAFKGVGATASGGSEAVRQWTAEFGQLTAELDAFIAKAKQVAQGSAVTNPLGGLDKSAVTGLGNSELAQFATTLQAKNFDPASAILKEYNTRLKDADAATLALATESKSAASSQDALAAAFTHVADGGRTFGTVSSTIDTALQRQAASTKTASDELKAYLEEQAAAGSKSTNTGFLAGADTSTAYSLMNTSFSLGATSAALLGVDGLAIKTAADFQQSFAQVERTVNGATANAAALKQQFIDLSTTIPVSFSDISNIAALGGQLGIGANNITEFTKATAEFAATTGMTVDAAATGLGRIGQLTEGDKANYEELASSILNVGANSVSTEPQIIAISTRIAGVGKTAGLSAADIVGFSGALASLGVQPYGSQGTVTRLFGNIEAAISAGGQKLQDFAQASNMTAQQFTQTWASSPKTVLEDLFKGIGAQGANATAAIEQLGFKSVQDIATLNKLAQQPKVVAQSFSDAEKGILSNATLLQHYGVMTDTVSAKVQILKNTWEALMASLGSSSTGFVAGGLDGITKLVQGFEAISHSGTAQVLLGIAAGATALVGGILALAAPLALITGQLILAKSALSAFGLEEERVNAIMSTASKWSLIGGGILSVGSALLALGVGLAAADGAFTTANDRAQAFSSSSSELQAALAKDKTAYDNGAGALDVYSKKAVLAAGSATSWSDALGNATAIQKSLKGGVDSTTGSIDAQTIAYGKNAKAALTNMLSQSSDFQKLFSNNGLKSELAKLGGSLPDFTKAILKDPENGASDYFQKLAADIKQQSSNFHVADAALAQLNPLKTFGESIQGAFSAATAASDALNATTGKAASNIITLGNAADSTAGQTANLSKQIDGQITTIFSSSVANETLSKDLATLGGEFLTQGANAAAGGSTMAKVITEIFNSSSGSAVAANRLQGFFNALVNGGYASAKQLGLLEQVIQKLGGATGAPTFNLAPLSDGFDKASAAAAKTAHSAQKAAKAVYDLAQYGSDLGSVMTRAFDIRTGPQTALDAISSGWNKIATNAKSAADAEAKAQATLATLASDRAIDQYWLSVAQAYGDTKRATELQAKLATNTTDTASAQQSLSDAQDKASTSLTGNSDAAIANRKTLEDLVKNYQTYIEKLASSGMSQDQLKNKTQELKQEFITQATQLGYNRSDVDNLAKSFDDMTRVINGVPRNITVSANTDPAQQALNEFLAKANAAKATVGVDAGSNPYQDGFGAGQQYGIGWITGVSSERNIIKIPAPVPGGYEYQAINASGGAVGNKFFDTGGYTGDGAVHDLAGFVHSGEYVFNQQATRNIGPANLALLHSLAQNGGGAGAASAGSHGAMDLSASTIMAIAEAVAQIRVVIPGVAVARAVSNNNVSSTRRGA